MGICKAKYLIKLILTIFDKNILMKKNILLFTALSFSSFYFSQLGKTGQVYVTETLGNSHPQIEITGDGQPAVIWTGAANKNLYFSKMVNGEFPNPIKLNPDGQLAQTYTWSGPDLAIENSNIYIVYHSLGYETGHVYFLKSSDNGLTFSDTVRVDNLSAGFAQYPDVAVLNDTIFTTFMQHDAGGVNPQYVLSRSFDGGLTFESAILASELLGDEACDCCPPEIVVNQNFVAILFRNNASNIRDIKGVISLDRGNTFTQIADIDKHQWLINACPSTGPDGGFASSNELLTAYKSEETGSGKVFLNSFDLNSNTTNGTILISDNLNSANYPQIAVKNDTIGVVFEANGSGTDVYFNYSFDGYANLNTSNLVNLTNITGTQGKPDIKFYDGEFHVCYSDGSKLTYLKMANTLGLTKISKETVGDLVYSKSIKNHIEAIGENAYSIEGKKLKISKLDSFENGTYFIPNFDTNSIQKLVVIP
jgi:hypothetical protein